MPGCPSDQWFTERNNRKPLLTVMLTNRFYSKKKDKVWVKQQNEQRNSQEGQLQASGHAFPIRVVRCLQSKPQA